MKIKLILILYFFSTSSFCQLVVTAKLGQGFYKMQELKSYQNLLRSSFPVDPKITASFPNFWFYEIQMKHLLKNKSFAGLSGSYGSTGGRIYYSDYSGSTTNEQLLSFKSYAILIGFSLYKPNDFISINLEIKPGIIGTDLLIRPTTTINNASQTAEIKLQSTNVMVEPTLDFQFRRGSWALSFFLGYNFNVIKGSLNYSADNRYLLLNQPTVADWSGVRTGVGASYQFKKETETSSNFRNMSIGLGLGFDYGGIGTNIIFYPRNNVGVFAGVGYALAGFGYNAGVKIRKHNIDKVSPYVTAMYGYNAAIVVLNASTFDKLFYGPSIGIGLDTKHRETRSSYWSFGVNIPIRSSEVNKYIDDLKTRGIKFDNTLLPVAFTIGYRIY
jgi:hypothetical protein